MAMIDETGEAGASRWPQLPHHRAGTPGNDQRLFSAAASCIWTRLIPRPWVKRHRRQAPSAGGAVLSAPQSGPLGCGRRQRPRPPHLLASCRLSLPRQPSHTLSRRVGRCSVFTACTPAVPPPPPFRKKLNTKKRGSQRGHRHIARVLLFFAGFPSRCRHGTTMRSGNERVMRPPLWSGYISSWRWSPCPPEPESRRCGTRADWATPTPVRARTCVCP